MLPLGVGGKKCPCCSSRFADPLQTLEHRRRTHGGPIPVHCPFCGMGYQSLTPMHNHLRQHLQLPHGNPDSEASSAGGSGSGSLPPSLPSPPPPSLLRCFYCPLVAAAGDSGSAALVVAHVLEAHRDKFAHVCEVCEQRFASREPLLVHVGQAHLAAGATVVAVKSLSPDSPVVAGPPVSSVSSSSSSSSTPSFVRASFKSEPAEEVDDIKNRSTPPPPPTAPQPPPTPLPAKSVRAFPELLAVNSDIFRSFPPEAQRRIQLIVKQGRRAVLTINDNKGGVQKISFGKSQTLSTSTTTTTATATAAAESVSTTIFRRPTSPPVSSSPPDFSGGGGGGGEEEVGVREGCFLRAVKEEEERVAVRDFAVPVWEETPRSAAVDCLVLDMNLAAGEVDAAAAAAAAAAADTPGVVVEREVVTETSGVAEEMEAATPGTFGIAAGTEIAAGPSSVASVKLEVDSGDLGVKTEPEDHNTGGASASSVAAKTEVITGMLSVATEMEVVTGAPGGEIAGTVDLSELATTVTVQTSDAETLALSADDFLKLMKDSHSADEGRK